jgi:DNA polymerase elongation subunit (family B)
MTGLDAVFETMKLSIEAGERVSALLPRPHNWDFEKCIYPFLLLSKKRYCGAYYTKMKTDEKGEPLSLVDDYYINSMGIVLKRRDNPNILKYIYGGVIDILMRGIRDPDIQALVEKDPTLDLRKVMIEKALSFVQRETRRVLAGQFNIKYFVISKSLRAHYDNEELIPHKILANRIAERDPGNAPPPNTRMEYALVAVPGKRKDVRQGDRIETVDYIQRNNLKIDYEAYVEDTISKPVAEIFSLVLEQLPGFQKVAHSKEFKLSDPEWDEEKTREKRIAATEKFIFDPILRDHRMKAQGQLKIDDLFKKGKM